MFRSNNFTKKYMSTQWNQYKRTETIIMNPENSESFETCMFVLNLTDKINIERSNKYIVQSNLSIYYT